jgi:hypothetical protein
MGVSSSSLTRRWSMTLRAGSAREIAAFGTVVGRPRRSASPSPPLASQSLTVLVLLLLWIGAGALFRANGSRHYRRLPQTFVLSRTSDGGCGHGQKEPRALGVRRGARRSVSRNVRPAWQTLDRPLRSQLMELGSELCGARLGLAIPSIAKAGKAE